MKTNNVMVRPMGQFNVSQRTKDGFFNATVIKLFTLSLNNNKFVKIYEFIWIVRRNAISLQTLSKINIGIFQ